VYPSLKQACTEASLPSIMAAVRFFATLMGIQRAISTAKVIAKAFGAVIRVNSHASVATGTLNVSAKCQLLQK
jgi:hypothetical protein